MENFRGDFIQYDEKKKKSETQNLAAYLTVHITIYILLIFFAIFFSWYTVFISTHSYYQVYGASMMPTLNARIVDESSENSRKQTYDAVYIDRSTKAQVFDIVVIDKKYSTEEKSVIKRLMAEAGDYISVAIDNTSEEKFVHFYRIPNLQDKTSYTDEMALVQEDADENGYHIKSYEEWTEEINTRYTSVTKGDFTYSQNFVKSYLKIDESLTLEQIKQLDREDLFISERGLIYVKVPEGKFFYLGDNRANSEDSLMLTSFEDASNIIGRGEIIVYDYNFANRLWAVIKFYFSQVEKFFAK